MTNGDSEFGIIMGNLSNRKNVPQKVRRYSEYGGESSGNNSRVTCTTLTFALHFAACSLALAVAEVMPSPSLGLI